jgi:hypothetical protein
MGHRAIAFALATAIGATLTLLLLGGCQAGVSREAGDVVTLGDLQLHVPAGYGAWRPSVETGDGEEVTWVFTPVDEQQPTVHIGYAFPEAELPPGVDILVSEIETDEATSASVDIAGVPTDAKVRWFDQGGADVASVRFNWAQTGYEVTVFFASRGADRGELDDLLGEILR